MVFNPLNLAISGGETWDQADRLAVVEILWRFSQCIEQVRCGDASELAFMGYTATAEIPTAMPTTFQGNPNDFRRCLMGLFERAMTDCPTPRSAAFGPAHQGRPQAAPMQPPGFPVWGQGQLTLGTQPHYGPQQPNRMPTGQGNQPPYGAHQPNRMLTGQGSKATGQGQATGQGNKATGQGSKDKGNKRSKPKQSKAAKRPSSPPKRPAKRTSPPPAAAPAPTAAQPTPATVAPSAMAQVQTQAEALCYRMWVADSQRKERIAKMEHEVQTTQARVLSLQAKSKGAAQPSKTADQPAATATQPAPSASAD